METAVCDLARQADALLYDSALPVQCGVAACEFLLRGEGGGLRDSAYMAVGDHHRLFRLSDAVGADCAPVPQTPETDGNGSVLRALRGWTMSFRQCALCGSGCAAYYVEDGQNRLVDEWQLDTDRAAVLSTMNIGVHLVEVVSLFASSAIVGLGIHWCFTVCGILLVLCGAVYVVRTKKE